MAAIRLTPSDVVLRAIAVAVSLTGAAISVGGVAMFWGPLRQVLAAPFIVALGVAAYIVGRAMWGTTDQDVRARP